MAEYKLYIAPAAHDDLEAIYRYSLGRWGAAKAARYLGQLSEVLWGLASNPEVGHKRMDIRPDIRSMVVAKHVVFFRINESRVEIVRILHGRQDPGRNFVV
jgi:toxin ParE1/3/4